MYCRALGIIDSPNCFEGDLRKFFSKTAHKEINILKCGLADYAIIEHLLEAIPDMPLAPINIFVCDICDSPLKLCEWHIKRK